MRGLAGSVPRARYLAALALLVVGLVVYVVKDASADAGNPILGTIGGSVVVNVTKDANGNPTCNIDSAPYCTATVYVRGQWNWYSHNSDCNTDRAGAGVGIIWNDPTEPGYTVSKGAISQQVGVASLRAGDTVNQVDEMVHPSDIGNVAENYPGLGGQKFSDPGPSGSGGVTAAQLANWYGGCGREPLTATAPQASGVNSSGKTCGDGTLDCSGHPWGSWGYSVNGGLGYAHTYAKLSDISNVCVNYYDVHGGGNAGTANFQRPNGTSEITVDKNGDNSIQTNSFNTAQGTNCYSFARTGAPVTTAIHQTQNGQDKTVTGIAVNTTVHDVVTVTGANNVTPTGTVTFSWYTNGTCNGTATATSPAVTLSGSGNTATADSGAFTQTPSTPGQYGFLAHYAGDVNYTAKDGACEPLTVVDANIAITPLTATNAVGNPHVFTATVKANTGGGFVAAPDGTPVTFSIANGPGALTPANGACTTSGGSCTVSLNSTTTGTTTLKASATVTVAGATLTRATGDGLAGDGTNATKTWVNGKLTITPATAVNPLGTTHTLTITAAPVNGTIDAGSYTATASLVAGSVGSFVGGVNTCTFTAAVPNCTVVITSNAAGTSTVTATSTFKVNGQSVSPSTSPASGGSGDAVKNWVVASIDITKSPKTQTIASGSTATFTITVTNNGAVALNNVHVDDALSPNCSKTKADNNAFASLAVGSSVTYTCTLANVTANFTNTAKATGSPQGGGPDVTDQDTADVVVNQPLKAAVDIVKSPKTQTVPTGGTANFTITATNTGSQALLNVHIDDPQAPNCSRTKADNPALASWAPGSSISYTCTLANVTTGFTNVATVTGSPQDGSKDVTASDSAVVTVITPAISISKTPKSQTINSGDSANFTIAVTNTGAVTLLNVHVDDPASPDCAKTSANIAAFASFPPGATQTYTCTLANVTSSFTNTATATGTPQGGGPDVKATDTANVTVNPPHGGGGGTPAISITKNPKTQTITKGNAASFSITVTNTGTVSLTNVTVVDPLAPDCSKAGAQIPDLLSMGPGVSLTYNCSLQNVTASFTNVATATGTGNGQTVTATDTANVTVNTPPTPPPPPPPAKTPHPAITIVKDPASQTIGKGGTATFRITVRNSGDTVLNDVTVSDPLTPTCNRALGRLAAGQSRHYTCTRTNVTANFENVATATGKPPTGSPVQASDNAQVKVAPFLPPQTPRVSISKTPKHQTLTTQIKSTGSGTAKNTTVTYGAAHFQIKVTNTGNVALHDVVVTDPATSGCAQKIGTLNPGQSIHYQCQRPAVTKDFRNVATVTGVSPKGVKVHASDHADVTVGVKTTSSGGTSGASFTG